VVRYRGILKGDNDGSQTLTRGWRYREIFRVITTRSDCITDHEQKNKSQKSVTVRRPCTTILL
jgi:hypothetical protein